MDRYCNQDEAAFQAGRIILDIEFVAGSSGAVPTALSGYVRSAGIDSMSLAATGKYTVHLTDSYIGLASASMQVTQATYSAAAGQQGYPIVVDVDDATDPLVTFQMTRPDTGAAIAVTASDTVRIKLELLRLENDAG